MVLPLAREHYCILFPPDLIGFLGRIWSVDWSGMLMDLSAFFPEYTIYIVFHTVPCHQLFRRCWQFFGLHFSSFVGFFLRLFVFFALGVDLYFWWVTVATKEDFAPDDYREAPQSSSDEEADQTSL